MKRLFLLLAAALLTALPAQAVDDPGWKRYRNDQFNFTVDYPSALFRAQPLEENGGEGKLFEWHAGKARFAVWGQTNDRNISLADLRRDWEADRSDIVYRAGGRHWFVISGYDGDNIFYQKHVIARDRSRLHSLVVEYPKARKKFFDPIVTRMSGSFSVPR